MPLTNEERAEILARRGGSRMAPATSGLPPDVEAMIGQAPGTPGGPRTMGSRGVTMNAPVPASTVQAQMRQRMLEQLASQKLKSEEAVPTADQRDRITIASEALRKVQAVRSTLGVNGQQLSNRKPLTIWKQTPDQVNNPFLAPDAKQLRTQFNSAADLLAMLRTGKQGEKTQVNRVIAEYNPGEFDDNETVMDRLNEMENEIRAFASGELKSPLDAQITPSGVPGASPLSHLTDEQLKAIIGQ